MLSICSTSHENGGSRSRTNKHIVWRTTLRLGDHGHRNDLVHPVDLIRFSRANPSGSSGQDKTRIGEDRANAIRIVGPHQIYR